MEGNIRDGFALRSLLVGLTAIAFALSCTSGAAAAGVTPRNSMEPTLVGRINDVRAAHGLRRLRVSSLLTNAATQHAKSMGAAGYFRAALYTPLHRDGWTPYGTWIHWYWPGAGYTSGRAAENRAWGATDLSARTAVKRWMKSARNRANLLTARWRHVGVAAVRVSDPVGYYGRRDDVTIVVAELGRRKGKRRQVAPPPPSPPPAGETAYHRSFEPPWGNATTPDKPWLTLEDPCSDPVPGGLMFCQWWFITQYNPPECPELQSAETLSGSYALRMPVRTQDVVGTALQRCEIGKLRRPDTFTSDYFHVGLKLEEDWGENASEGASLNQVQYAWISGSTAGLAADDQSFCCGYGGDFDALYVTINAGNCSGATGDICQYFSGYPIGTMGANAYTPKNMPGPLYVIPPGQLPRGVWIDVIYRIYWTPDPNGVVEGWWKYGSEPDNAYRHTLSAGPPGQGYALEGNFATLQMGPRQDTPVTITRDMLAANQGPDNEDKFGQYSGSYMSDGGIADSWFDNWCRATSFEAAASC
jgi:uncharacterized protein YkwD